jgi:hypothetical protein
MNRMIATASVLVLNLAFTGTLWLVYRAYTATNYWQSDYASHLLGWLFVVTIVFLYGWRTLVRRAAASSPRLWLSFGSGCWMGATVAVYIVFVLLNAAAVRPAS